MGGMASWPASSLVPGFTTSGACGPSVWVCSQRAARVAPLTVNAWSLVTRARHGSPAKPLFRYAPCNYGVQHTQCQGQGWHRTQSKRPQPLCVRVCFGVGVAGGEPLTVGRHRQKCTAGGWGEVGDGDARLSAALGLPRPALGVLYLCTSPGTHPALPCRGGALAVACGFLRRFWRRPTTPPPRRVPPHTH